MPIEQLDTIKFPNLSWAWEAEAEFQTGLAVDPLQAPPTALLVTPGGIDIAEVANVVGGGARFADDRASIAACLSAWPGRDQ